MRRKILTAGFLSAILIMFTFAGFATSNNLKPQNETDTVTNGNLVTTLETVLDGYNDITLDELYAAELLIQEQIHQTLSEKYVLFPPNGIICSALSQLVDACRTQANIWRQKANLYPDNPEWVAFCNWVADGFDNEGDFWQALYNIGCT